MKIRNGFVSNSSSSSFVIKYRHLDYTQKGCKHKFFLTKEKLNLLKKYGFRYTRANNPYFVGVKEFPYETKLKSFNKWDNINLGYDVTCNQTDVIYFLLKKEIPFVALCHYDQELVFWDGSNEWYWQFPNIVEAFARNIGEQTFDQGDWIDEMFERNSVTLKAKRIKINEWLDKEAKFMGI